MVVIACTPCLASTLGPTALGAAAALGLVKQSKKKKKKKKTSKNKKGGGELEMSQKDYEAMVIEQNKSINEDRIRMIQQKEKEKERMNLKMRQLKIRKEDMRKEYERVINGETEGYL